MDIFARALKQIITRDYAPYADNCDGGGGNAKMLREATEQKYTLFPNPNDGSFVIRQAIKNEEPIHIRIFNTLCSLVYSSDRRFYNKENNLGLSSLVPGFYYIQVVDKISGQFVLNFIKK